MAELHGRGAAEWTKRNECDTEAWQFLSAIGPFKLVIDRTQKYHFPEESYGGVQTRSKPPQLRISPELRVGNPS